MFPYLTLHIKVDLKYFKELGIDQIPYNTLRKTQNSLGYGLQGMSSKIWLIYKDNKSEKEQIGTISN